MKRKGRSVRGMFEASLTRFYRSQGYTRMTITEWLERDHYGNYFHWPTAVAYVMYRAGRRSGGGKR